MPFLVGVDIGGTFTDATAVSTEDGRVYAAKARSNPEDLITGLMDALDLLAEQIGSSTAELLRDTVKFAHGTTQTSNVIFTWTGARTGLITTRGFADELLMMRARGRVAGLSLAARRHLRATSKPQKIVPRDLILEVPERVDHRGRVVLSLRETEAARAVDALLARGVESIAVSLLWSPANPNHELLLERIIRERNPRIHVTLSHRLAPVLGEYERTATAVVNAFVGPTVARYLDRLIATLRDRGLGVPVLVLQASGGVVRADKTVPVHTIESGPAAGMVAVKALATTMRQPNVIATDVGGTTFKVGLLVSGASTMTPEAIINQYSLLIPKVDLVSIGAGGGSIAWADQGRLRIGPMSAGADPGPACYGWGGTSPTVTDADLVLGFLNPERFLHERLRLDAGLAEKAIRESVAKPLFDGDIVQAAGGIRQIVDAQMGDLIRKATIERGHDPRSFVLMAYGGAGPLHAGGYALAAGVQKIIVPEGATVYSAYGAAASDIHHTLQRSVSPDLLEDEAGLAEAYEALESEARELLTSQNVDPAAIRLLRWANMRYERQLHDIQVSLPPQLPELANALCRAFEERYASLYGTGAVLANAGVQLLRIGLDAVGPIEKPEIPVAEPGQTDPSSAAYGTRRVFWPEAGTWVETAIFDGPHLQPSNRVPGPAVIEHPGTTITVPEGAWAEIDGYRNTVITLVDKQE